MRIKRFIVLWKTITFFIVFHKECFKCNITWNYVAYLGLYNFRSFMIIPFVRTDHHSRLFSIKKYLNLNSFMIFLCLFVSCSFVLLKMLFGRLQCFPVYYLINFLYDCTILFFFSCNWFLLTIILNFFRSVVLFPHA